MATVRPTKPQGKPIAWTDQQIEALSQVSEADKLAAAALWHDRAPRPLADLLDADTQHVKI